MLKNNKSVRIRIISILTLSIILIGTFSTVATATTYYSTLAKGTEFFQVSTFNETAWQTTVSTNSNPSDWFEGDANITGAQSKFTTMGWTSVTWEMYDVLTLIILTDIDALNVLMTIGQFGYNETEINDNYTNTYSLISGIRSEWYFISGAFNESYNSATDMSIILSNPIDYKKILDDYNDLVSVIQADFFGPADATVKAVFQNMTADDFLWQIALNNLAMGSPISMYIEELVDSLGCENASYSGNKLIIERIGEANYTVELTYGVQGTLTSFVVKDATGTIIYQFISMGNTNWIVYIIVGVIVGCLSVVVVYIAYKKRKFNKLIR